MRYLGDQHGAAFYKLLEQGPSDGVADLEAAVGQPFPTFFADFGLALYTDSLPGLRPALPEFRRNKEPLRGRPGSALPNR